MLEFTALRSSALLTRRLAQIGFTATHFPQLASLYFKLRALGCNIFPGRAHGAACGLQKIGHPYMTSALSTTQKLVALNYHYRQFGRSGFDLQGRTVVYPGSGATSDYTIVLGRSEVTTFEGESVVEFLLHRKSIYRLTFTLVPAGLFHPGDRGGAIFIGGSQGSARSLEDLKVATDLCQGIGPQTMCLLALRALAKVWGFRCLFAVGTQQHVVTKIRNQGETRRCGYDDLWASHGGAELGGHFELSVDDLDRPITSKNRAHRHRAKKRRALRLAFQDQMEAVLHDVVLKPPRISPVASGVRALQPLLAPWLGYFPAVGLIPIF